MIIVQAIMIVKRLLVEREMFLLRGLFCIYNILYYIRCYRQGIMTVQPSDIIIVNIEEVSNGLQITFYVQTQSGVVVSANTVQSAVNVSQSFYRILL